MIVDLSKKKTADSNLSSFSSRYLVKFGSLQLGYHVAHIPNRDPFLIRWFPGIVDLQAELPITTPFSKLT